MNIFDECRFVSKLRSVLKDSLPKNTVIHINDGISRDVLLGNSYNKVFADGLREIVIGQDASECSKYFPNGKISIDMKVAVQTVDTFHELNHYYQDLDYADGNMHDTLYEDIVQTEPTDFYKKAHNHDLFMKEIESDQMGVLGAFRFFKSSDMAKKYEIIVVCFARCGILHMDTESIIGSIIGSAKEVISESVISETEYECAPGYL